MSYKKTSIKQVIADIDQNKIYLPALQRKFVWRKDQIELLFDSLMRNYPFGTFLFWRLLKRKAESYVFYEFLREYDQRNPYNRRSSSVFLHPEITGVLDGQQRLSSMYVGLMGSHTEKAPYKRISNPDAYEKTFLYLNLLSLPYAIDAEDKITTSEDKYFEFRFRTEEGADTSVNRRVTTEGGATSGDDAAFWMKGGQVLSWDEEPEFDHLIDGLSARCKTDQQRAAFKHQRRLITRGLSALHQRIHKDELVNYFEVAKDDLRDILKIFVRVNSGGTTLSKTDLLFSTIVATWDNGREQIEGLLKTINAKGDGFDFSNEYLMRCCLILSDGPVLYKVNSFKSENVKRIQDEWPKIADAIGKTVDLLVEFGFNRSVLTSQNATIIIAYYIYKGGDQTTQSRAGIRKYLIHALLNRIYSTAQEQLIGTLRNYFRKEVISETGAIEYKGRHGSFSFDQILNVTLPQQLSLAVTPADIERFLQSTKGSTSFFLLSLLYPQLRYNEVAFHQDHIHPAAGFTDEQFEEVRIPADQWQTWRDRRDCVPNLQLMEGKQNICKNAAPLKVWFELKSRMDQSKFVNDNYFPPAIGLDFKDFMDFFDKRKEILRSELTKVLAMSSRKTSDEPITTNDRNDADAEGSWAMVDEAG